MSPIWLHPAHCLTVLTAYQHVQPRVCNRQWRTKTQKTTYALVLALMGRTNFHLIQFLSRSVISISQIGKFWVILSFCIGKMGQHFTTRFGQARRGVASFFCLTICIQTHVRMVWQCIRLGCLCLAARLWPDSGLLSSVLSEQDGTPRIWWSLIQLTIRSRLLVQAFTSFKSKPFAIVCQWNKKWSS